MFTKKTQGIFPNLFPLGRKFSNFVLRTSSTLRNFLTFLVLDFSQVSDALRKRLKFHINVRLGLKKLLNRLLDLSFYWVIISSIFRSSNTRFLYWMWLLYLKYIISSEGGAAPFPKNERYTNWFGSFDFHIYLKLDNLRHYEWISRIQNSEGRLKCVQRWDKSTFSFSLGKR